MIGVSLQGRLGNQLFQYAFAYSTAKKLNTRYFIDMSLEIPSVPVYFNIEKSLTTCLGRHIYTIKSFNYFFALFFRRHLSNKFKNLLFHRALSFKFDEKPETVLYALENNVLYGGFFQSERYFEPFKEEIRKLFKIKPSLSKKYSADFKSVFNNKKIVTLHIRRTDYQQLEAMNLGKSDLTLPTSYYHRLVEKLAGEHVIFVFISDEPQFIEDEFAYIENKYISQADEITDFQHMLNADICIISNSTFSWWAAWLNEKTSKQVYCPKYFLGFHIQKTVPDQIYPNDWIQVEVS